MKAAPNAPHRAATRPRVLRLILAVVTCLSASAEEHRLLELSLEELMNVEITSVSKKPESLQDAAAAVYVVTEEDIKHSGATNLADVLRLVPGVNVARLDATRASISIRGYAGRYANKLLVLVDGQSVYSPLFSGTYWELEEVLLEDIERIEVIRGPGGTLWGANAVNGVINIITKSAADTQGVLVALGGGSEDRGRVAVRLGDTIGDAVHYRVFGSFHKHDEGAPYNGNDAADEWDRLNGGARFDWQVNERDKLTFTATALYMDTHGLLNETKIRLLDDGIYEDRSRYGKGGFMARWERNNGDQGAVQLQLYYHRWESVDRLLDERRDLVEIDYQQRRKLGKSNDLMWGLGYRFTTDNTIGEIRLDPDARNDNTFQAFIQDEIELVHDKLKLIVGTKLEHNDYTGLELGPNVRAVYTPNEKHTAWAAVSRAFRSPARIETDAEIPNMSLPGLEVGLIGRKDYQSEDVISYELGYRWTPTEKFSADLALFYARYGNLRTVELRWPRIVWDFPPRLMIPFAARNNASSDNSGVELTLNWKPKNWWRLRAGYSYLDINLDLDARTLDLFTAETAGDAPRHSAWIWSSMHTTDKTNLDVMLRYVGELRTLDVEDYLELDVRFGWQPNDHVELAIIGQNLLHERHQEFGTSIVGNLPSQVERGVYGQVTWKF